MQAKSSFRFEYRRPAGVCPEDKRTGFFTIDLSQDEFEDYQALKARVHHELDVIGIPQHESAYWVEAPPYSLDQLKKLAIAFGSGNATLIPHYAHGWHYNHYHQAVVDGVRYRYMGFQGGEFIKFAPDIEQPSPPLPMGTLFDGPVRLHDHGHIQTPEHAALFKTGELDLPGQPIQHVAVRFCNFAFNAAQKRADAVFEALDTTGQHLGHYFASAFKTLVL
ncbi:hypothetical protein RQP54_18300 [Curvibacter sp. APW13]|uniref:hypothetical protein n=1 Tax=Curvibacter sp. APW13 TaxID=3077236 RepID=UPI0028E018C2|nr:hypothetical protein [Curvibacter sp. APW13]MDT8992831.1 hypothetical protein [Curvibacter sp. APW13]